jgi:uncharacterized protein (TIGR02246 family)
MKPSEARTELIKSDEQWARAWAARDLSGLMLYFHEDAVVITPAAAVTTGKRDIINLMASMFTLPGFAKRMVLQQADTAESGDLGYTLGNYETTVSEAAGKSATHGGHYLAVWRKGPDRTWKIAAYSATPAATGAKK